MSDSRRKHLPPVERAKRKKRPKTAAPERRPDLRTGKQRRAADKASLRRET